MLKKDIQSSKVEKVTPEDFESYKSVIPDFFNSIDLYALRFGENIVAFMGVLGEKLEMLFVSGEERRKGYGKALLKYAVDKLGVKKVDVNEQNRQAIVFYEKFDFKVIVRSEKNSNE